MPNPQTSYTKNRGKTPDGLPNQVDLYVGNRIKLRRNIFGWSQEKLGQMLGLTFQQIQKYEKGQNRVSASRLYDFANILQVDVNFFFTDMPQTTQAASPRFIQTTATYQATNDFKTTDPIQTTKIQQLINNFLHINNKHAAEKIFELMEVLGKSSYIRKK